MIYSKFFGGCLCAVSFSLSLSYLSPTANALEARIDQFVVLKDTGNGAGLRQYINDPFDDGNPPPSSESFFGNGSTPVSYNTRGLFTESGSKAIFDTLFGFPALGQAGTLLGEPIILSRALARTNINNATTNGLKKIHPFEVRGLFDVVVPQKKSDVYGISLTDRALSIGNEGGDNVRLQVVKTRIGGLNVVRLSRSNFETDFVDLAGSWPLNPLADKILLVLSRNCTFPCGSTPEDQEIHAKFAYVTGPMDISGDISDLTFTTLSNTIQTSNPLGSGDIGQPITIFNGEEYTRVQFRVRVRDDVTAAQLTTESPASMSRLVDTPSTNFSLSFIYRFETTTGTLTVSLDGEPLAVIPAPNVLNPSFTAFNIDVTNPLLQNLPDALLDFTINDATPGSTVLLDNIAFPGLPVENFSDETTSNWDTDGNVGVLVVESPEDSEIVVNYAKQQGDSLKIKGDFIVDTNVSDGLNMPEDVIVDVGGQEQTIPASAFVPNNGGKHFLFNGTVPGIKQLHIHDDGRFQVKFNGDLSGVDLANPVPFSILIGNDLGQTEVNF